MAQSARDVLASIEYGDQPAVLVFADGDAALERARRTAAAAGCRIAAELPVDAAAVSAAEPAAAAALVELDGDAPGLDALLDRLNAAAAAGRLGAVVSAPEALIDPVAARTPDAGVRQLCCASEPERVLALAEAAAPRPPRLHDIGRDGTALLHRLSEEMSRMASILAALSEEEAAAPAGAPLLESEGEEALDPGLIRSIIRARRLRDQFFRGGLFADPAWDMLLDLMAARLEGNRVPVSSLCIAAAVPATTALRWIKTLTDQGLLVRTADPSDGRRVYIQLSEQTARDLAAYLRAAQRLGPVAI